MLMMHVNSVYVGVLVGVDFYLVSNNRMIMVDLNVIRYLMIVGVDC